MGAAPVAPPPRPTLGERLAYCYLLRIPLITAAIMVLFPLGALLPGAPLESLFANLFAFGPIATGVTTVLALLVAWSVLLTGRLVLLNGQERFGIRQWLTVNHISRKAVLMAVAIALPMVFGQFLRTNDFDLQGKTFWLNMAAVAVGALLAYLLAFVALIATVYLSPQGTHRAAQSFPAFGFMKTILDKCDEHSIFKTTFWVRLGTWLANHIPERWTAGYVDRRPHFHDAEGNKVPNTGFGLPWSGHWLAICFSAATFSLYWGIDWYKQTHLGEPTPIPALAFVLILILNCNWGLSLMAFFLDRFRVPLLVPLTLLAVLGTHTEASDHYFTVHQGVDKAAIYPYDVLEPRIARNAQYGGPKKPIIIVVTAGGGIQASSWTAQVLAGLQLESKSWGEQSFADSVVLISSVSGGAVASLFFMNQFAPGSDIQHSGFQLANTEQNGNDLVEMASAASLDDVAWGLVYRDIPRIAVPYGTSGQDLLLDRGRMLELSWQNRAGIFADLSNWRTGVKEGWRPAVIFNATIAETGEPLLLSTTDFTKGSHAVLDRSTAQPERKSLDDWMPNVDIPVVTAVRLAASFPYVAPASRPQHDGPEYHVVDGGYYDNYGVSSAVEWLDRALEEARRKGTLNKLPPILILQIRSFPDDALPARQNRGWFYQAYAPIDGLMSVRTSAQLIRDRDQLRLLRDKWLSAEKVRIHFAGFKFEDKDAPLSWKMTRKQIDNVKANWRKKAEENGEDLRQVHCMFNLNAKSDEECKRLAEKDPW